MEAQGCAEVMEASGAPSQRPFQTTVRTFGSYTNVIPNAMEAMEEFETEEEYDLIYIF